MASEPWLKFYAADYLLDGKVDRLPLEAQAILVRMWCICHIESSCPTDAEEIARKSRLSTRAVAQHHEQLCEFFELRDGRLYSPRMDAERRKSEAARTSANRRWNKPDANGNAKRNADGNAQSQSQSQKNTPPPEGSQDVDFLLQKKETKIEFSQADFDARDLRKMQKAQEKFNQKCRAAQGCPLPKWMHDERQVFEWICREAGITVQRGLELDDLQTRWPDQVPEWAREQSAEGRPK